MKLSILAALAACLITATAFADQLGTASTLFEPGDQNDLHFDAGVGYQFTKGNRDRLVLGVQFHGLNQSGEPGTSWRLFWVEGKFSKPTTDGTNAPNAQSAMSYDIKVTPLTKLSGSDESRYKIELLPTNIHKNFDFGNEGMTVRLFQASSLVDTSYDESDSFDDRGLFIGGAINALGYSWLKQKFKAAGTTEQFDGLYFVGAQIRVGLDVKLKGSLAQGLKLRFNFFDGAAAAHRKHVQAHIESGISLLLRKKNMELEAFGKAQLRGQSIYASTKINDTVPEDSEELEKGETSILTGINVRW